MQSLTRNQCVQIVGGDPGGVLAGSGSGVGAGVGGGGWSNGDMALAGMGIGFEGGPPAIVSIGLPGDVPLSGFDKGLVGAVAGAAGAFTVAGLEYLAIGIIGTSIALPAAIGLVGVGVALAVGYGANELLQYAANDGAYTDGHGLRHAAR
jgi:hypothetical protein